MNQVAPSSVDSSSTQSDAPSLEVTVAGLRAERDRLLREVLFLRSGQMLGGGGDDLDLAARIAAHREQELRSLRLDLAATTSLLRSHGTDIEIKLEASRQRNEELDQQLYTLSARVAAADARTAELAADAAHAGARIAELSAQVAAANARVAELEASTSWQITAPVRVITGRLGSLR